eukprot:scpid54387/ scgid26519/ COP9 signalosome complex subunit 4
MDISSQLDAICEMVKTDIKEASTLSTRLLQQVLQLCGNERFEALKTLVDSMVYESMVLVISRLVLSTIADQLSTLPLQEARPLSEYLVEKLTSRMISFEEQIAVARTFLAGILENEERWREAALMLAAIPTETGQKQFSSEYKLKTYLHIAQLHLEDGNVADGESYVNRASLLQGDTKDEKLKLLYSVCYARVLDNRRKFLEAAHRYYTISYHALVHESQRVESLRHALVCTVLASAGQPRTRMLGLLFKDERCQRLSEFPILEKMYLQRIIRSEELKEFSATLKPHQCATTVDGTSTILEHAAIEHNILAASKLYSNIRFAELGRLLSTSPDQAERIVCQMISESRMTGRIDQIEHVVYFADVNPILTLDDRIEQLCAQTNTIYSQIQELHPEWAESKLASIQASLQA